MRPGKLFLLLFLALCSTSVSCGKKGDPFLPVEEPKGRITLLQGEWTGEHVELTGRIHGGRRAGERIRVFYAGYPLDQPPCEGCPIAYEGFQSFGREVVDNGEFLCRMKTVEPGNLYFFEARILSQWGGLGPPSNRVSLEVR